MAPVVTFVNVSVTVLAAVTRPVTSTPAGRLPLIGVTITVDEVMAPLTLMVVVCVPPFAAMLGQP
jgi:hypothetical protein